MKVARRRTLPRALRVVVEVDGQPIGFMNLDMERLWPAISHRKRERTPIEWMEGPNFDLAIRAAVYGRLMRRLKDRLYQALGDEMVRAELDLEMFHLRAEAAAHAFGRKSADIDALVAKGSSSREDFIEFFWEYLFAEREPASLQKSWKAKSKRVNKKK